MRALLFAAVLAAGAVLHPPVSAQSLAAAQPDSAALTLAKMVAPLESRMTAELELARTAILKLPASDKDAGALEKEYPGIHAAMWTVMEPEMRAYLATDVPKLWTSLARVYEETLSPAQMQALTRFYATPTGERMLRMVMDNADPMPLLEAVIANPDDPISRKVLEKSNAAGRAAFVGSLEDADHPALEQLVAIVPLPKLDRVGKQVQRVTLAWVNEEDPEFDARLDAIMGPAMEKYMAEADARK